MLYCDETMHIAIFTDFPDSSIGGSQTSVRAQRSALRAAGHKVTMVTPLPRGSGATDQDTIYVPGLPLLPYDYPLVVPSKRHEQWIISELAKRMPVDVIHTQTDSSIGIMGVRIASQLNKPLVQTMHTRADVFMQKTLKFPLLITLPACMIHRFKLGVKPTHVPRQDEPLSAHYSWKVMVHHAEQADIVTVPSRHFADRLKLHGLTKPIEVISNGLSDEHIEAIWSELPNQPPKASLPLRAVWVSRLSPEKRPLLCLEAVKDLPNVTVDFYGDGVDEAAMRDYIKMHGLEERVKLRGRVSQHKVIKLIADHDLLIHNSYHFDNQPMVLLEASAVGVPAVLSDPDLAESLTPGGYIVAKTPDATGLRDVLAGLADRPEKIDAMRKIVWENRKSILQSDMTVKMVEVYNRAIELARARK